MRVVDVAAGARGGVAVGAAADVLQAAGAARAQAEAWTRKAEGFEVVAFRGKGLGGVVAENLPWR